MRRIFNNSNKFKKGDLISIIDEPRNKGIITGKTITKENEILWEIKPTFWGMNSKYDNWSGVYPSTQYIPEGVLVKFKKSEDEYDKKRKRFIMFETKQDEDEEDEDEEDEDEIEEYKLDDIFFNEDTQGKVEEYNYKLYKILLFENKNKNSEFNKLLNIIESYEKEQIIIYDQDTPNNREYGFGQVLCITTKSKLKNARENSEDSEYEEYALLENLHDEGILFCSFLYSKVDNPFRFIKERVQKHSILDNYQINFSVEFPYINKKGEEDFEIIEEILNQKKYINKNKIELCYEIIIYSLKKVIQSLKRKNIHLVRNR